MTVVSSNAIDLPLTVDAFDGGIGELPVEVERRPADRLVARGNLIDAGEDVVHRFELPGSNSARPVRFFASSTASFRMSHRITHGRNQVTMMMDPSEPKM